MPCRLDHLVIAAGELAGGVAWATGRLGCPPDGGGRHAGMGTHNALWRLGPAYLEVIAIDPEAARPAVPRWFGLDDPALARRIAGAPALVSWAVSVGSFDPITARAPLPLAPPEACARDGLTWEIARPQTPALALGGAWPLLIRWRTGGHPASGLPDRGLALDRLAIGGPEAGRVATALGPVDSPAPIAFDPDDRAPAVSAVIARADGGRIAL